MQPTVSILLVDDEPRNLDALEAILSNCGYQLIRAGGADDALRALLKHDVAAMVLDIYMPEVNGVELARLIKSRKHFSEIPIIFLTAHVGEDQEVIAGYGAGAVDYLTKPVNPEILRRKIAVFADVFRKTRALAELNETLEARVQQRTAELEKSEAALRQAARQKDEFLATLAHELRNPLAPLRLGIDLLLRSASPEANRSLLVMNRQLDHMVRLIDDLLDVARISSGKLELKRERTNVAESVHTAIEICRPLFERRRQVVSARLDASIFAFADPTRLAQIVGNLLHNAAKFTPDEGHIQVHLTLDGASAQISVIDAGVGIPEQQLALVFDMFTRIRSPAAGANDGLGIGLALARKLAHMHEGELTARSDGIGKGSTFTFSLPAEAGTAELAAAVTSTPGPTTRGSAVHVLVIEDNLDSAEMLVLSLQSRGFIPSVAHTGAAGLALVLERQPRIILCDIGLPEMDGLEVCRRVRQLTLGSDP